MGENPPQSQPHPYPQTQPSRSATGEGTGGLSPPPWPVSAGGEGGSQHPSRLCSWRVAVAGGGCCSLGSALLCPPPAPVHRESYLFLNSHGGSQQGGGWQGVSEVAGDTNRLFPLHPSPAPPLGVLPMGPEADPGHCCAGNTGRCLWEGPAVTPPCSHPADPHPSAPCHSCQLQVLAGFGRGDVGAVSGGRGQLGGVGVWGGGFRTIQPALTQH